MTAAALLEQVRTAGFRLRVDGDVLMVSPASRLTDGMRASIRAHRPALVALLLAERLTMAINAAVLARGDTEHNRRELLAEALGLPAAQQLDLAEHFEAVTSIWQAACRGVVP